MSVLIGSKLGAQQLQRCFLPLPEVSAVWSWRPIQTPLTAQSSFSFGSMMLTVLENFMGHTRNVLLPMKENKNIMPLDWNTLRTIKNEGSSNHCTYK